MCEVLLGSAILREFKTRLTVPSSSGWIDVAHLLAPQGPKREKCGTSILKNTVVYLV